uniref:cGMP-dependent protein kinase interacting domain-containing protein n=1 Tax=Ascaris lumbricoides TaxID=6252 RepID=A0A9J2Q666_ASCLU
LQEADVFLSACLSGDLEEVQTLLDNGADINTCTVDGLTALHQAVIDGKPEMVQFLCDHGADLNAQDNEGWTPLHAAACCGNLDLVEYLCMEGADISVTNSDKELAVDLAEEDDCRIALEEEHRRRNVDPDECRNSLSFFFPGWTPLHAAACCGNLDLVEYLCMEGADISVTNSDKELAVDLAEEDDCRIALEEEHRRRNVDPDECRNREMMIMRRDAEEWLRDGEYRDRPHSRTGASALHVAAAKGYTDVMRIQLRAGADVNCRDRDGWTPLHAAAHWGEREAATLLVNNGASFNELTNNGESVLNVADKDVVEFLEALQEKERTKQASSNSVNVLMQTNTTLKRAGSVSSVLRMSTEEKLKKTKLDEQDENKDLREGKYSLIIEEKSPSPSVECCLPYPVAARESSETPTEQERAGSVSSVLRMSTEEKLKKTKLDEQDENKDLREGKYSLIIEEKSPSPSVECCLPYPVAARESSETPTEQERSSKSSSTSSEERSSSTSTSESKSDSAKWPEAGAKKDVLTERVSAKVSLIPQRPDVLSRPEVSSRLDGSSRLENAMVSGNPARPNVFPQSKHQVDRSSSERSSDSSTNNAQQPHARNIASPEVVSSRTPSTDSTSSSVLISRPGWTHDGKRVFPIQKESSLSTASPPESPLLKKSSSVQRTGSIQSTLPWMALYRSSSSTQAPTNPAFMHFQSVVRQASASGRPAAVPPLALASGGTPSIPVSKVPPPPVSSAAAPTQQTRGSFVTPTPPTEPNMPKESEAERRSKAKRQRDSRRLVFHQMYGFRKFRAYFCVKKVF